MVRRKKTMCPYCGSEHIAEYLYGMPAYDEEFQKDLKDGKIIIAGCVITDSDPEYRCHDCGKDFGGNLKKMTVSEDKVLEFANKCGFEGIEYLGAYKGDHVYDIIIEKYPNPFRVHYLGHPSYILVNGDEIKFYCDVNLEITDHFYPDEENDEDDNIEEQLTENGEGKS